MGKKRDNASLGRAVIKDRFKAGRRKQGNSHLHTTDLDDGYDWNRINLKSVTEENTLDEFLATAEMAGTEFVAEKLNYAVVVPADHTGIPSAEEQQKLKAAQDSHRQLLTVPRRPVWDENTTAEELDQRERDAFLDWRRGLAKLQEVEGIIMTPYERNLDFWRQLWRVIERSDVVVQIVDARNPLLFRCEDLEAYVREVGGEDKVCMLLFNKADLLSEKQRKCWAEYFDRINVRIAFWSAVEELERIKEEAAALKASEASQESDDDDEENDVDDDESDEDDEDEEGAEMEGSDHDSDWTDVPSDELSSDDDESQDRSANIDAIRGEMSELAVKNTSANAASAPVEGQPAKVASSSMDGKPADELRSVAGAGRSEVDDGGAAESLDKRKDGSAKRNDSKVLSGLELIEHFKSLRKPGREEDDGLLTIGLVGYPNVGKSSTVNALLQTKKVPVSATPGRTKHFQTLYLDESLMLCDCPGLVMPTFVSTKAEMITDGILPIDQMRDYVAPVSLVCKHIRRDDLEMVYGIMLPQPGERDLDKSRPPTAHELLTCHASIRGFMTHKGIPDFQRSSRQILKDFVNGKLLYCHPPPGISEKDFESSSQRSNKTKATSKPVDASVLASPLTSSDKEYFTKMAEPRAGTKGVGGVVGFTRLEGYTKHCSLTGGVPAGPQPPALPGTQTTLPGRPQSKRHNKGHTKGKLRQQFGYMDA